MTAMIFLVIIDNLLLTLAARLPILVLRARPITDVDVVPVVVVGDALDAIYHGDLNQPWIEKTLWDSIR